MLSLCLVIVNKDMLLKIYFIDNEIVVQNTAWVIKSSPKQFRFYP